MNIFQKLVEALIRIFSRKSSSPPSTPITLPHNQPSTSIPSSTEPTVSESATSLIKDLKQLDILKEIKFSVTAEQLKQIIPTLLDNKCKEYLPYLLHTMNEFEISAPLRIVAFIAQTAHESAGYSAFSENLNYSAQALLKTWPARFTQESAATYARQPEKIANHVYASRLGNGDETSGDGWKYRGRGVIQTTGRSNYKACGVGLNLDLVAFPELLEQPLNAFRSAGWYWKSRNCNFFADSGDFISLTKTINGGLNGLDDRKIYYIRAKSVFGIA